MDDKMKLRAKKGEPLFRRGTGKDYQPGRKQAGNGGRKLRKILKRMEDRRKNYPSTSAGGMRMHMPGSQKKS